MRLFITVFALFGFLGFATVSQADISKTYVKVSENLVSQGDIAYGNEKFEDAKNLFEQATVANPQNIMAYIGMGKSQVALGFYAIGVRNFETALKLNPVQMDALEGLALANLEAMNKDKATESLAKIKKICGDDPCPAAERVEKALAEFKDIKPKNPLDDL
jgi:tetratricopeptide (TPR) repeat protein